MRRLMAALLMGCVAMGWAQRPLPLPPPRVLADTVPPDVPAAVVDPAFALRVHLLTVRWGGSTAVYHGYGSGNLLDAAGDKGFAFGFQCDVPFVDNRQAGETYQARWKREGYQLEILTEEEGTVRPHYHVCTLRLAFRDRLAQPGNTVRLEHGVSSSLRVRWQDPDFALQEPDPDYPVRFHVVDGRRTEDFYGDHGWGTANVTDTAAVPQIQGAEYRYDCSYGFLTSTQLTEYLQGRWVRPGMELEVLLQRPGSDKVDKCRVQVVLGPQVYAEPRVVRDQGPVPVSTQP